MIDMAQKKYPGPVTEKTGPGLHGARMVLEDRPDQRRKGILTLGRISVKGSRPSRFGPQRLPGDALAV